MTNYWFEKSFFNDFSVVNKPQLLLKDDKVGFYVMQYKYLCCVLFDDIFVLKAHQYAIFQSFHS